MAPPTPVVWLSTNTLYNDLTAASRSTLTITLQSGASRMLICMAGIANSAAVSDPPTGGLSFAGVAMSKVTMSPPAGGNSVMGQVWSYPISDGSSGDYPITFLKDSTVMGVLLVAMQFANVNQSAISSVQSNLANAN